YLLWISAACLGLTVLVTLACLLPGYEVDYTEIPLTQNKYLKGIIEPIKIVDCMIFADGGSMGLAFEDSRHVKGAVCLEYNVDFEAKNLSFDFVPDPDTRVPIAGIEEKALIGLLQRWRRQDPEAREWHDRMGRYRSADWRTPSTPEQHNKAF